MAHFKTNLVLTNYICCKFSKKLSVTVKSIYGVHWRLNEQYRIFANVMSCWYKVLKSNSNIDL